MTTPTLAKLMRTRRGPLSPRSRRLLATSCAADRPAARATGDDVVAVDLLHESRTIRVAIGDRAGVAECDADLASLATHA